MPTKSTLTAAAAATAATAATTVPQLCKDAFAASALGRELFAVHAFRIRTVKAHSTKTARGLATKYDEKYELFVAYLHHRKGILAQLEADEDFSRWPRKERAQIEKIINHSETAAGQIAFRDMGEFSRGEQKPATEELKWRTANNDRVDFHFRNSSQRHCPITVVKMDDGYTYIVFQIERREIDSRGKWWAIAKELAEGSAAPAAPAAAAAAAPAAPAAATAAADDNLTTLQLELAALKAENAALKAEIAYLKHKKTA